VRTGKRLRLFIIARIVVTILFLASTIILKISSSEAIGDLQFRGLIELMVLSCLFSAASLAALKHLAWLLQLTRLQIVWDILFVTFLLMLTDGIASPYSFLYLLAIMNAGMLLNRQQALYTAALCLILYGGMVDLQYYGMLEIIGLTPNEARLRGDVIIFYTLFLHLVGFVLAAIMGSHLAERARVTEQALRATEVNYEELKQLHSTIVENLDSGFLTINRDGLVRVFNPYVEKLTGITQTKAYGQRIESIFPALSFREIESITDIKGEFFYRSPSDKSFTIGYVAVPFKNLEAETAGLILTLKDLTSLKQMQLALKRADRLAALGELSARMAHEIRNPLAAISGSVQLLSEQGGLQEQEYRLLAIVMRESERLNGLITDFLAYARPRTPNPECFYLEPFISDLHTLLSTDARCMKIRLVKSIDKGIKVFADRDQLHQVLLNLIHNAADAMPDGGEILVSAELQTRANNGKVSLELCLKVADQGVGIDEETCKHLFEPFWSTKPAGTGLGLATVYRIVEAHGGTVQPEKREGGGTVFTIHLPMNQEEQGENQNSGC